MNKQEAQELLPWFVSGTLSDDENRAVQAFIDSGDITDAEVNELSVFAEAVAEQSQEEVSYNPAILQNVMAQLDEVEQETPLVVGEAVRESSNDTAASTGLLAGLANLFGWSNQTTFGRVALAGQFAVIIALGALLFGQPTETATESVYGTVSGSDNPATMASAVGDIQIAVAPGLSEADFRELLGSIGAEIIGGPNSVGIYKLKLPEGSDIDTVLLELQANAAIPYAQKVTQ